MSGIALSAALVDFEAHFVSDPLELAGLGPGGGIRFADLDILRAAADRWPTQPCWPRMIQVASFSFARILRFVRPCAAMPVGAKVGAMGERFVAPQRVLIDSVRQRTIDRDTLMERMAAESEAVQQELRDALANTEMESWLRADLECWLEVARRPQHPSPFAIMPGRPEDLAALLCTMREHLDLAYAHQTNRTDQSHLKAWKEACARLAGAPTWRQTWVSTRSDTVASCS